MLNVDKTALLTEFLGSLPRYVAALLARAVELDRLMDGKALPHEDISRASGPRCATDAEKPEMAPRYDRLVMGSRHFAAGACFAAKQKDAYEELCAWLRSYNEDLVREMRAPDNQSVVETQLKFAVDLTAVLFSEEDAELLRRRGRAALAAASAA